MSNRIEVWTGLPSEEDGVEVTNVCLYDEKLYSPDKPVVGFRIKGQDGEYRSMKDVVIENFRPFIDDLRKFNRSRSRKSQGGYVFHKSGVDQYTQTPDENFLTNCPICKKDVHLEDAFLSFGGFTVHDYLFGNGTYFQKDSDFDCIHKECVPDFADLLETEVMNSEVLAVFL